MVTRYGVTMTRSPEERVPLGRIETPRLVYVVIAVCTVAAAFLRFYQLSRPGYLSGSPNTTTAYSSATPCGWSAA